MRDAIAAEWMKLSRHRATWGLVWVWAMGVVVFGLLALIIDVANGPGDAGGPPIAAAWIANMTGLWEAPGQAFGRYMIGAFVAVAFAGEYGWNTWKLIVPHRARTSLIAAKYAMVLVLLVCGFVLAALLFNLFGWIEDVVTGDPIPPGVTALALARAHAVGALAALPPILLTTAYVSLAAILTRSTVAALVIGLVVTTAEQAFGALAPMLEPYAPGLIGGLNTVLPGYHLANVAGWIGSGDVLQVPFPSGPFSMPAAASLAILAGWIALLAGLTFSTFRRQDIN
jgi:ABC-2 type transport system permease protein